MSFEKDKNEEKYQDNKLNLYRYVPVYRLIEIFSTKQIALLRTDMWQDKDPFEGFLYEHCVKDNKNWKQLRINRDNLYCLCFSLATEQDQIWRSYTPEKNGVMIKINATELVQSLKIGYLLGDIKYKNIDDVKELINETTANEKPAEKDLLELFLCKRLGFKYDREIRLMTIDFEETNAVKKIPFDPKTLIREIIFDPRMDDFSYEEHKEYITGKFSYDERRIEKSGLYSPGKVFL